MDDFKHKQITDKIIKAFYKVYNALGYGFLEKVYENALFIELIEMELSVEQQKPIKVSYYGKAVGEYFADLVVNNQIIVELKTAENLSDAHVAQLLNYLKATEIEVGLLLNFGQKPSFRRKVFSNQRKSLASVFNNP
jgi:GxxExxY protein